MALRRKQQQIALDQEFGKSLWLLNQTENGLATLQQEFESEIINLTDLALPSDLSTILQTDHYLYLFNQEQRVVWYIALNNAQLLQVGPPMKTPTLPPFGLTSYY